MMGFWYSRQTQKLFLLLIGIFYLAFAIRGGHPVLDGDAPEYLRLIAQVCEGQGLVSEDGTPLVYRPPGYPWAAGYFASLFSACLSVKILYLFNVISLWLSVLLLFGMIRRLARRNPSLPWVVMLIPYFVALYPFFWTHIGFVMTECWAVFCVLAFVWVYLWARDSQASRPQARALLLGIVAGALVLTRTVLLAPLGAILCLEVFLSPSVLARKKAFLGVSLVLLGLLIILGPYAFRNRETGHVLSSQAPYAFFGGTVSNHIEDWNHYPELLEVTKDAARTGKKLEKALWEASFQRIADHPLGYAKLVMVRSFRFMAPSREYFISSGYSQVGSRPFWYLAAFGFQVIVFALAIVGSVLAWRRKNMDLIFLSVLVWGYALVYVFFFVVPRYQIPVLPLVFLLALSFWRKTTFNPK